MNTSSRSRKTANGRHSHESGVHDPMNGIEQAVQQTTEDVAETVREPVGI